MRQVHTLTVTEATVTQEGEGPILFSPGEERQRQSQLCFQSALKRERLGSQRISKLCAVQLLPWVATGSVGTGDTREDTFALEGAIQAFPACSPSVETLLVRLDVPSLIHLANTSVSSTTYLRPALSYILRIQTQVPGIVGLDSGKCMVCWLVRRAMETQKGVVTGGQGGPHREGDV